MTTPDVVRAAARRPLHRPADPTRRQLGIGVAALVGASGISLTTTACTRPGGADADLVIATDRIGGYNPVAGYSVEGASPFYDGLLGVAEDAGEGPMPDLVPALAAELPEPSDDLRTWTVRLREDVTFSDGTALDSAAVKATYDAILDPASASEVIDIFRMIREVEAPDARTVVFHLTEPTGSFASCLLIGILPASAIEAGVPAADWAVAGAPVGTGPYTLTSLEGDTLVITAREDYWGGAPELTTVAFQAYADTLAMAEAVRSGAVDGANVPPRSAADLATEGRTLITGRAADWRGISLPGDNPLTADPRVRLALNFGVDRERMVATVLAGHGIVASHPVGAFYGDAYDPDAAFPHDPQRAASLLDEAGWAAGADGMRSKDGAAAELRILHRAGDALRGEIAADLVEQLAGLGIAATAEGASWDAIDPHLTTAAIVFGGGDLPYSLDQQIRGPLHSRTETSGTYDNPSDIVIEGLDEAIDGAAAEPDPARAAELYRQAQALYIEEPSWLFLVMLEHTYISSAEGWSHPGPAFEPHAHGADWGPWWDLAAWRRES